MLKRPSEFSQSNIKGLQTASATYRSLQSFCNYQPSAASFQLSASMSDNALPLFIGFRWPPMAESFFLED
jgi:hypothetical protein